MKKNKNFTTKKYSLIYDVIPKNYYDIKINYAELSARLSNVLIRESINSFGEILEFSEEDFSNFNCAGRKTIRELSHYVKNQINNFIDKGILKKSITLTPKQRLETIDILANQTTDLGLIYDLLENTNQDTDYSNSIKLLKYYIGDERCKEFIDNTDSFEYFHTIVDNLNKDIDFSLKNNIYLKKEFLTIPIRRKKQKLLNYLLVFLKDCSRAVELIECMGFDANDTITELSKVNLSLLEANNSIIMNSFIEWLNFDIKEMTNEFLEKVYYAKHEDTESRNKKVLVQRVRNSTLESIGNELNITRERVRQLEKKVLDRAEKYIPNYNFIWLISLECGSDKILTLEELSEYFCDRTDEMVYILKHIDSSVSKYLYNNDLKIFSIDVEIDSKLEHLASLIPADFHAMELGEYLDKWALEVNLPSKVIIKYIGFNYKKSGNMFYQGGLKISDVCDKILYKYYPNGLKCDQQNIDEFKQKIIEEYGSIKLVEGTRAIIARIQSTAILYDRGTYISKSRVSISIELLNEIREFIDDYSYSIISMHTIYGFFKNKLKKAKINNRYFLHGLLKEHFGRMYSFKRDYLLKDSSEESLVQSIRVFVKSHSYPVSKNEILNEFSNITDIMVTLALAEEEFINYFGKYLHVDYLDFLEEDKMFLKKSIDDIVIDEEIHNFRDVYKFIQSRNNNFLLRYYITSPYGLISITKYLFKDEYSFSQGDIAKKGIVIKTQIERLKEFVSLTTEVSTKDLSEFLKKNKMLSHSLIDYINECNEYVLIKNNNYLAAISEFGIDENIVKIMEENIKNELQDKKFSLIREIECFKSFPTINYSWNEWNVYSILNKYSDVLSVSLSDRFYSRAVPIVCVRGYEDEIDIKTLQDNRFDLQLSNFDYLEDIDLLLEEMDFDFFDDKI